MAERRFRCYTKTGDEGFSSLFNGERRKKDDLVFAALGDVDELNSAVGLAAEYCRQEGLVDICTQISTIQSRLLDVGSAVATPSTSAKAKVERVKFDAGSVDTVEQWLDEMDDQLPPLTQFILPSGGLAAAHLHVARTICRRAERAVVGLNSPDTTSEAEGPESAGTKDKSGTASDQVAGDSVGSTTEKLAQLEMGKGVEPSVVKFLNRLSDYLFTAARFAAMKAGREETTYRKAR